MPSYEQWLANHPAKNNTNNTPDVTQPSAAPSSYGDSAYEQWLANHPANRTPVTTPQTTPNTTPSGISSITPGKISISPSSPEPIGAPTQTPSREFYLPYYRGDQSEYQKEKGYLVRDVENYRNELLGLGYDPNMISSLFGDFWKRFEDNEAQTIRMHDGIGSLQVPLYTGDDAKWEQDRELFKNSVLGLRDEQLKLGTNPEFAKEYIGSFWRNFQQYEADSKKAYADALAKYAEEYSDPAAVSRAKAYMDSAARQLEEAKAGYSRDNIPYTVSQDVQRNYDNIVAEYGKDSPEAQRIRALYPWLDENDYQTRVIAAAQEAYDYYEREYNKALARYYAYLPYRSDFTSGTDAPSQLQAPNGVVREIVERIFGRATEDEFDRLDELSPQEIDTYNYLLNTQGYVAAREYLEFIKEDLNRRAGQSRSAEIEGIDSRFGKFLARSDLSLTGGIDNFANGLIGNFSNEPRPVSVTQFARMFNREEQADDGIQVKSEAYKAAVRERNELQGKVKRGEGTAEDAARLRELNAQIAEMEESGADKEALTILGSTTSQIWNDLLFTGANMAPSMALGAVTGMPLLGSGTLGFSAAGNAYQEKLREGWTNDEARAYGTLIGVSESMLTYVLSGMGSLGAASSVGAKVTSAMSKLGSNPATKFVFTMLGRAIPEAIEEGAQSILEPVFEAAVRKTDFNAPNWEQVFYDALMGGIMGMVMGGGHTGNVQTNTETQQTTPTAQTPQAEQRAAPAAETRQTAPVQPNVSPEAQAILSKDSLSNNDVRRILENASLRAEIESVVGAPVPIDRSSASNQRAAVKEYFNAYKSQSGENAAGQTQAVTEPQTAPQTENASTDDSQGLNSTDAVTQALQTIGALPQTEQNAPVSPVQTTETVATDPVQQRLEDLGILPPQAPPPSTNGIQSEGAAPMQTQPNTPQTPQTGTEVNSQNLGQGTARPQVEGGDLVATQTHGSDSLYTDAERSMDGLRPEDSVHERHTDAAVDAVVEQRYQADRDGEKAYLFESGERWTDADTALAHRILADAVEEARKTGDYSEVVRLQREWERQGTTEGQALRQRGRFVESPEHIVAEAAEALSGESARKNLTPTERNEIIGQVDQLAHEAASITEGDTASVIEMIKRLNEVRRTTGLFSTKTGKGLSRALEQAAKMPDGYAFLKSVLNAQIRGVANDYTSPGAVNVIQTIRNQNMLSNFSTILRNLVANNILDPLEAWSTNQGVLLDMLLSKLTGTRSTAVDLGWFSKAKWKGTGEGFVKSYIQEALDANIENATGKYEGRAGRTFKMTGNMVERVLSTWQKYLNYGLKTTDEAQKGGIRAETQRGIDRLKEKGLLAEDAMQNRAEEVALDRTLQTDGAAARLATGVRNALDVIGAEDSQGNRIGVGSLVLPFAKVPANATAKIAQYTPVGVIETGTQVTKALIEAKRGTLTPERQAKIVQSVGRNATAVELVTLFTYAALVGALTVGGDDDKDKEASERSQGKQGTQLNLSVLYRALTGEEADEDGKDIVLDLSFAEVLNANMAMGAAIAEAYKEDGKISAGDILEANVSSAFQAIIDFPALQQFGSIIDDYNYSKGETEGEKLADVAVGFMGNAASSFVVPNIVRGFAKGTDPYVRDVYGGETQLQQQIDNIKSGIPYLRETLPVAKDSWGNDRTYTGNETLDFINATINPGRVSYVTNDPVLDELGRLSDAGITGLYPERSAPREIKSGDESLPLTQEERALYLERAGGLIKEYYTGMQNSEAWGKLKTDEQKGEALRLLKQVAYAKVDEDFLRSGQLAPDKMSATERIISALDSPYDYVAEYITGREADKLLSNNEKMTDAQYTEFRTVADEKAELLLGQFTGSAAYGHMSEEQRSDIMNDILGLSNAYGKKEVDPNATGQYDDELLLSDPVGYFINYSRAKAEAESRGEQFTTRGMDFFQYLFHAGTSKEDLSVLAKNVGGETYKTATQLSDPVGYIIGLGTIEDYQEQQGGTFSKSDPDVFKAFIDMDMSNEDLSVLSGNLSDSKKRTYDVMTEMLGQDMANTIFASVDTQNETGSDAAGWVKAQQISQIPNLTDEEKLTALEAYAPADSEDGKRSSIVRGYEAAAQNGIPFDQWTAFLVQSWAADSEGISNPNGHLDKAEMQEGARRAGIQQWWLPRKIYNDPSKYLGGWQIYDESAKQEKEPKVDKTFKRGDEGYLYDIAPWLRP